MPQTQNYWEVPEVWDFSSLKFKWQKNLNILVKFFSQSEYFQKFLYYNVDIGNLLMSRYIEFNIPYKIEQVNAPLQN